MRNGGAWVTFDKTCATRRVPVAVLLVLKEIFEPRVGQVVAGCFELQITVVAEIKISIKIGLLKKKFEQTLPNCLCIEQLLLISIKIHKAKVILF